ncbi:MAG TPA: hypothetical protein VN767_17890 [Streptosporangiaceae bacterium]|nr:hypothetical protein [Streptosporangiaceae bacterium]
MIDDFAKEYLHGHADILREQLGGAVGTDPRSTLAEEYDPAYWQNRCATIEQAAGKASLRSTLPF